ncbi:amino acid permease [Geothrix limicola]|uniref:Amino acid permease n=1 Tax=Geothrix limicola TaxID=2927978 RepID=A0ABQ5QG48_9BACT|nr:APC family permease [Geothrix limicola]GLH73501.1 amino acid permease [Geothrix limicola]
MPNVRSFLLGRRLSTEESHETKISNPIALAVFSSDALSSVAYGTQEIMAPLTAAIAIFGAGVLGWSWWVALGIVGLLLILNVSYRQTIHAYPSGGGAYLVAKDNLGEAAAQTAGASLLIDYILTVAVSVSAGVSAIISAFPGLEAHRIFLAEGIIAFIALMNLRGVKESGLVFSLPTYGFVVCIVGLLLKGFWNVATGHEVITAHAAVAHVEGTSKLAALWLLARAYSAGCTALTGVEAISNGVTAFKDPVSRNASKTMTWMVVILGTMFLGITYLTNHYGLTYHPDSPETLLSQLTRIILGGAEHGFPRLVYLVTTGFTMAILALAANTAYADFPRLAALHARDGFLPRQFTSQGDRLVFSNGIFILSLAAGVLVLLFGGKEDHLLPLYAVGVFLGFTISQTGMVRRWFRLKGKAWQLKALINGVGAVTTCIVMLVIAVTRFAHGAWIVIVLVPLMVMTFFNIHRHYIRIKSILAASRVDFVGPRRNRVVVLVSGIHAGVVQALNYAKVIADRGEVEALTVDFPDERGRDSAALDKLQSDWPRYCEGIPLRALRSPYRKVVEPIVQELERMRKVEPEYTITVILPEFITGHWWANLLHNQTAWRIKGTLLLMPKIIVISIPYHVEPVIE